MEQQIKLPLTYKKLTAWCNEEFKRMEITGYTVIKIERTRYRMDDYEAGAATMIATVQNDSVDQNRHPLLGTFWFNCFYWLKEYETEMKRGKQLCLRFENNFSSLRNITIDFKK